MTKRHQSLSLLPLQSDRDDIHSATVRSPTSRFHLENLPEFTSYTFWASAFNGEGEGALGPEVTSRTFSDVPADPPQNVTVEPDSSK